MAIDIDIIQSEIVDRLKILDPEKIILFGSHAYGIPDEDSDVDVFIIKSMPKSQARDFTLTARKLLRDLVFKHKVGFDIIAAPEDYIRNRKDPFYRDDILTRGKVIYVK